jgi:hypothetical protein
MASASRLPLSLFLLRIGVFVVMFFWTLDKFIRPDHAAGVFAAFYKIEGLGPTIMYIMAAIEMAIILGFVAGWQKKWTYGFVLIVHAISTLSSYAQYFAPFDKGNLLFFAAWPMLAACYALFALRDEDTLFSVSK